MSQRDSICASAEKPEVVSRPSDTRSRKCLCYERMLVEKIKSGEWWIKPNGEVWSTGSRKRRYPFRADRLTNKGYRKVAVYVPETGKKINCLVHRLVWQAAFGDIPEWAVINHKNGIRDDNRLENLEICTDGHNSRHAIAIGNKRVRYGSETSHSKLTERDVAGIRKLFRAKCPCPLIANLFSVSVKTIYGIKYEGRWSHVK